MVKQTSKQTIVEYIQVIVGASLVGFGYNMFLLPAKLAAGGVSGISTLLYELFQWNPAFVQFSINLPLFLVGLLILGKDFSTKTLLGTFFVPFVIWLTQDVDLHIHDAMLGAIYGGIALGIGLGIVYRGGGSTGGTAMIAQLLKKFTGLSSGFAQLLVDGFVVAASAIVFNLELALFALISIYVTSKVIDFVQLQTSPTKLVMIITEKEAEIQRIIRDEIDRGLTKVKSLGGYSNMERTIILCVVEQSEAVYLKKVLQEQEPTSFVIFLNASEILGRGFTQAKVDGGKV
ncbi:YitT family protein [Lederbergia citrea]|uniref:YitT family protein n=1 Tax=Lederbergia citrea TaxID=2833581 RepID=A0A942URM8_9BACI|nr:YitT family protein [Lederbergia citrea]MBS4178642.1 YitT family protein [Lederbergia citrea]MBS4205329.1 YitT family protein [Lederbergia citrea]MBS4224357.1 YitT family protein [Lederbergia citrea]